MKRFLVHQRLYLRSATSCCDHQEEVLYVDDKNNRYETEAKDKKAKKEEEQRNDSYGKYSRIGKLAV